MVVTKDGTRDARWEAMVVAPRDDLVLLRHVGPADSKAFARAENSGAFPLCPRTGGQYELVEQKMLKTDVMWHMAVTHTAKKREWVWGLTSSRDA